MSEHAIALRRRVLMGGAAVVLSASMALSPLAVAPAHATPASAKQAEAQAALSSLNAMQSKLAEAESNYGAAMVEQDEARQRMEDAQARIDEASGQISDLQGQLGTRARNMYMSGATSFLDILLGASSFQAFTNNWDLLNAMNQSDADMVQETKELRSEVEEKKAEYAEQEKVAAAKAEEMAAIVKDSEALVNQQQAVYDNLSAEAAELVRQEQAAQEAQRQQEIANRPSTGGGSSNSGGSGNSGNGGSSNSGGGSREPAYVPSSGNAIVDRARSWVGRAEYVWGACSPGAFDCSGFVSYCLTGSYSRLGTTGTFMNWPRVSNPQPGDVAVNYGHCGIYVGGGQMIHAATFGVGVIQGPVQSGMIFVRR